MQTTTGITSGNQLLKWVGNKQRMASEIIRFFPDNYATYFEPFLGSGAVLGTLAPKKAIASDILAPLMGIWELVRDDPETLITAYAHYRDRIEQGEDKRSVYAEALQAYNAHPNSKDFIFLSRACYGGVIRFRRKDGAMSTPCGAHMPISTASFRGRVMAWHAAVSDVDFRTSDFRPIFAEVTAGDLVYCDPPYVDSQKILYGAQSFCLADLIEQINEAKNRGAYVALSIDGSKRSGLHTILHDFPEGLFETEVDITVGRSMLKRFQRNGESLADEVVKDRLLLTYTPALQSTLNF